MVCFCYVLQFLFWVGYISSLLCLFNSGLSKTQVGSDKIQSQTSETTITKTVINYSHDLSAGISTGVAVLDDNLSVKDNISFSSERTLSRQNSRSSKEFEHVTIQDSYAFDDNGGRAYRNDSDHLTIAERILEKVVDVSTLRSASPDMFENLTASLKGFNSDTDKLVITRTLSKEALFKINDPELSKADRATELAKPENYETTSISKETTSGKEMTTGPLGLSTNIINLEYERTVNVSRSNSETFLFKSPSQSNLETRREDIAAAA